MLPGGEGSTLASGISTRGSAVTTVISAVSAPRSSVIAPSPLASGTSPVMSGATSSVTVSVPSTVNTTTRTSRSVGSTLVDEATVCPSVTASMIPAAPGCTTPAPMNVVLPTPANVLPHFPPYHGGEQKGRETFQDWLDDFKAVDEHYKLVYLTTALRGTAKSFY